MGTNLWQCTLMVTVSLGDQATSTMIWYDPDTEPKSHFLILIMLSIWLKNDKHSLFSNWFDSTRGRTRGFKSHDLSKQEIYSLGLSIWSRSYKAEKMFIYLFYISLLDFFGLTTTKFISEWVLICDSAHLWWLNGHMEISPLIPWPDFPVSHIILCWVNQRCRTLSPLSTSINLVSHWLDLDGFRTPNILSILALYRFSHHIQSLLDISSLSWGIFNCKQQFHSIAPCPILAMLNAWLGSDMYKFLSYWFDLIKLWT